MKPLRWFKRALGRKKRQKARRRRAAEGGSSGNGSPVSAANGNVAAENGDGPNIPSDEPAITEEELSGLDQRDRKMLRSIIELDYTTVREVMVPRTDMVAIERTFSSSRMRAAIR